MRSPYAAVSVGPRECAMNVHVRAAVLTSVLLTTALLSSCVAGSPRSGEPHRAVPDSIGYAVVAADEATFAFPIVDGMAGRWPAASGVDFMHGYSWEVWTYGYSSPVVVSHVVVSDSAQRIPAFASLDAVLKSGELRQCWQDHWWFCARDALGQMRVEHRRPVLRLRDSTLVSRLREHRPRMASLVVRRLNYPVRMDSAVIEYSGY